MIRLLGIDPGLRFTGWGVIDVKDNRLFHVENGVISTDSTTSVPERQEKLYKELQTIITRLTPTEAAVEETYVNRNGSSTLKLGYARGIALLAPAMAGLTVSEYGALAIKKAVVGTGSASKIQVQTMVHHLLPGITITRSDASDALALAICHAHYRTSVHHIMTRVRN